MNATALPTYVKAESNTGTIHLALAGSAEAACASGKAKPLVTALPEAEMTKAITCKRCEKLALKLDSDRIAAAGSTADIDAVLEEAANALVAGDIEAAVEGTRKAGAMTRKAKGSKAKVDEATASDTEAAQEAAQRDAAEAAPAAPRQRIDQEKIILAYLTKRRGTACTPHEISKAVTPEGTKRLGLRDCCARLARDGKIAVAAEKPVSYFVA